MKIVYEHYNENRDFSAGLALLDNGKFAVVYAVEISYSDYQWIDGFSHRFDDYGDALKHTTLYGNCDSIRDLIDDYLSAVERSEIRKAEIEAETMMLRNVGAL